MLIKIKEKEQKIKSTIRLNSRKALNLWAVLELSGKIMTFFHPGSPENTIDQKESIGTQNLKLDQIRPSIWISGYLRK